VLRYVIPVVALLLDPAAVLLPVGSDTDTTGGQLNTLEAQGGVQEGGTRLRRGKPAGGPVTTPNRDLRASGHRSQRRKNERVGSRVPIDRRSQCVLIPS
jgi:hypothetical protein